jgi:hypothetical protein
VITVLTICSANYLSQAKALGDSLRVHHPEYHFVIGLVDRYPASLAPDYCVPYEVLPVESLEIREFREMCQRYNIIELNTAVKPFFMEYLYQRDAKVEAVVYFDPDILILGHDEALKENLKKYSIILTPHSCVYDEYDPDYKAELRLLKAGIYNLGFVATSRCPETSSFLHWWQKRLIRHSYARYGQGMFYDQYWAMLIPLFFRRVHVERNPGYNMAEWNLRERELSFQNNRWIVNGSSELFFFHFSGYKPSRPEVLAARTNPVFLGDHPELIPLFDEYKGRLEENRYKDLAGIECYFYPKLGPSFPSGRTRSKKGKSWIQNSVKAGLHILPRTMQEYLRRAGQFVVANTSD